MTPRLPGYRIDETPLYASDRSLVFRGTRSGDGAAVVLKMLSDPHPQPRQVARLRHEYEMARAIEVAGILEVLALEQHENSPVLISSDIGGSSLQQLLHEGRRFTLEEFLQLSVRLAEAVGGIHGERVVHKDITPGNVVWTDEGQVQLIDFGISTRLSQETASLLDRTVIEGTLAYMSPEQTGRMNRGMDYRTDLYSLGATLFHALTGRVPFRGEDFMEVVHAHIAKRPPGAHELRPDVPLPVSHVIARLLAKTPEERYQSAWALRADLVACLDTLRSTGTVSEIPASRHEVSDRFSIPQRLYGREGEIERLQEAFRRVSVGGRELVLVAGYSGVGKSALVAELHKPIVATRGHFVSGKCDPFQQDIPYAPFLQACAELIRQLLTEPAAEVKRWRRRLSRALGPNGAVVVEAVGELELLVGPQPPVPELGPREAENRFHLVFGDLLRAFASEDAPLAIFLDDLQWADPPTLELIERWLSDAEARHVLLIGAYRDNEVDEHHPLTETVEKLRRGGAALTTLELAPLRSEHVLDLVADTLKCPREEARTLAEICWEKTQGNPFFLNRFLISLREEGSIRFDPEAIRWTWDVDAIRAMDLADNVVDLLAQKIHTLPERAQQVLQLAACIGSSFDAHTLSIVDGGNPSETCAALWHGLVEGLVLPIGEDYKLLAYGLEGEEELAAARYRFLHDRVQQAAYSLIAPERRRAVHRQVGRLLLESLAPAEREERLFEIVNHLNRARELLENDAERDELARLNLQVGRKAQGSAAFDPALAYLRQGIALLDEAGWERQYELTLALHVEAVNAAYLRSAYEAMQGFVDAVRTRARTVLDRVRAREIEIVALIAQNRPAEGLACALEVLSELGVRFPRRPNRLHAVIALLHTKWLLLGRRIEDLAELPEMTDPVPQAAMRILASIASATVIAAPALFPLVTLEQVVLTLRHGANEHTPFALEAYGAILGGAFGDIDASYACGKVGIQLLERLNAKEVECKTRYGAAVYLNPWKEHFHRTWEACPVTYRMGLETGDVEFASYSAFMRLTFGFFGGRDLGDLELEGQRYLALMQKRGQETAHHYGAMVLQAAQNLLGRVEEPARLVGSCYDADALLAVHRESNDTLALAFNCLYRLILGTLFGAVEEALAAADAADEHLESFTSLVHLAIYRQFDALVRLRACDEAGPAERRRHLRRVRTARRALRHWAKHAPMNFEHRLELIEAELARVQGRTADAISGYERAIRGARVQGYLNDEALAAEVAARFYLDRDNRVVARAYLTEARYAYELWGAEAKAKQLSARVPRFEGGSSSTNTSRVSTTSSATSRNLDMETVFKASQAISGEILLGRLLERMMRILVENAGAERGALVLIGEEGPRVEAVLGEAESELQLGLNQPLEACQELSPGIVGYVLRSGESVVLDDAAELGDFRSDAYVRRNRPRSLLCAPVVKQGEVVGAVYLENNLTSGVFTPGRLEIIHLLASQAAISIENAKLYARVEDATRELRSSHEQLEDYSRTLESKVAERTRELSEKNLALEESLTNVQDMQQRIVTQEKLASLGALTAGIAHEINNPLNFVSNFAKLTVELSEELLETLDQEDWSQSDTREDARETMELMRLNASKIAEHGERAWTIVQNMLQHSREGNVKVEETDLNVALDSCLNLVVHSLRAKDSNCVVTIERDYAPGPLTIEAKAQDLSRAFLNVVENACYAAHRRALREGDGFAAQVQVTTRDHGERAEVRIRDNGDGISPELQERIFTPFFTTKPAGEGTGLGLSICHDVVMQVHRGELRVESQPGEFAEFVIVLPKTFPR